MKKKTKNPKKKLERGGDLFWLCQSLGELSLSAQKRLPNNSGGKQSGLGFQALVMSLNSDNFVLAGVSFTFVDSLTTLANELSDNELWTKWENKKGDVSFPAKLSVGKFC
jgi:hypothetical protein